MCTFCRSLFVLLYFLFRPLCCLFFFDLLILITPLVSSNSLSHKYLIFRFLQVSLRMSLKLKTKTFCNRQICMIQNLLFDLRVRWAKKICLAFNVHCLRILYINNDWIQQFWPFLGSSEDISSYTSSTVNFHHLYQTLISLKTVYYPLNLRH